MTKITKSRNFKTFLTNTFLMKNSILLSCLLLLFFSCKDQAVKTKETTPLPTQTNTFAIVIHGGAGNIRPEHLSSEKQEEYKTKLSEAIIVGYNILKNGGNSLDAVEQTIHILEDSPLFNAGKGAVFTNAETNELDASIMDGKTLNAGASAGTKTVKNPISLARAIMEKSPHVMLSREGAELFAQEQGLELVSPDYFYTEKSLNSLNRVKEAEKEKAAASLSPKDSDWKFGTVGCVALDKNGNLAAGTSTGGMTNKRWGRIGDAPIIGAGTYANNNTCGISATGWGEFFIRSVAAHDISAMMEYKGMTLKEATKEEIQNKIPKLGGDGGIVSIDKYGNIVMEFNTSGMFRASMNDSGELYVGIFKD